MQDQFDPRTTTPGYDPAVSVGVPRAARDAGLRSYMLKVYNYMASGVLLTGIVALLFAPYARDVLINANGTGLSGLGWLITFAPLGFVFAMSSASMHGDATLQLMFWAFAAVMGPMSTVSIKLPACRSRRCSSR
jgi:FtsH-binding integral membrane protein